NGTHGAGMTWSLIPKRLPMEVDRWVILSSSSVYLLGLSKHKVIGNDKIEGGNGGGCGERRRVGRMMKDVTVT
ncbi:MAG TPA: hypothetical protein VFI27_04360, partial [candidate division Zixibacteria bacterium]|nr:hypothetical protein [candidate division Zixibacteria bacterium]